MIEDSKGTNKSDQDILDVAYLVDGRHKQVSESVGFNGVVEELLVVFLEALNISLLIVEDFDDPLAIDHLFDIAVHLAKFNLLGNEEAGGHLGEVNDDEEDEERDTDDDACEHQIGEKHHDEAGNHRDDGVGHHWKSA